MSVDVRTEGTITAWVESRRVVGRIAFLDIRRGCEYRQIVVTEPELIDRVRRLRPQSLIRCRSEVVEGEFHATELDVLVDAPPLPFPVANERRETDNATPLRTQLRHPAVRLRGEHERSIFRLQSGVLNVLRETLDDQGFIEVVTPRFLSQPSEGGAALLRAQYFGGDVFLSQSTQLYRQMLLPELSRVYELTSIFHADPHSTRWHLNEFAALEVEFDGISGLSDIIDEAAELIRRVFEYLSGAGAEHVEPLDVALPETSDPLPRLHYREALEILLRQYDLDLSGRFNLTPTGNRLLSAWIRAHHGSDVAVLEGSPAQHSQFYDLTDSADPAYSQTFIVLCRGLSFVCGGQRMHRLENYERSIAERGMRCESLRDYLDVIADGMRPHGGFSIAIARLLAAVLELDNVRRAVMFPRDSSTFVP